ncbi:MAG: hypothetical protein ABIZ04_07585 [Opitutus sp.]
MNTRRAFLRTAALGAATAAVLPQRVTSAVATSEPTGSTKRNPVSSGHRNLFNGDSCVFFYNPEKWQPEDFTVADVDGRPAAVGGPFKAKAIHRFVENLAKSGVDTFLVNANASRAWYPSKVIPTILDGYRRGDREYFRGHAICQGITEKAEEEKFIDRIMAFMNLYQDLLDAKVDWLAEAAAACREQRISPWVSIRMNDFHGHRNIEGSFFNAPLLKNPAMRLKHSGYSPTMRDPSYRTALNFERPEVRAFMFAQIKEVVEDYDYEGLELDWLRNPLCCEPNATPETVAMMSDWLREVRALTQRRAKKTGKPYPLGLRIPGGLETLKSIGLDVVTLCRDGTLDFISPSGFWCTSWEMPHDDLRKAVGERVAIYGVVEDGINHLPARSLTLNRTERVRYLSSSREGLYANAAGKHALGIDGIEWFNFYCTDQTRIPGLISDYTSLHDVHRPEFLRGKPKHYSFSTWSDFVIHPPFEVPPQLAIVLKPTGSHPFRIPMMSEPADASLELVVQIVLKTDETIAALPVSFNGCWPKVDQAATDQLLFPCGSLTHHIAENTGYNYRFPLSLIREGWNQVVVENGGTQPITVVCIELAVRSVDRRASS